MSLWTICETKRRRGVVSSHRDKSCKQAHRRMSCEDTVQSQCDQFATSELYRYRALTLRQTTSWILIASSSLLSGVLVPDPVSGVLAPSCGLPSPPGIGVTIPLGGTGILISSGEAGIISGGRSGILMRFASLL